MTRRRRAALAVGVVGAAVVLTAGACDDGSLDDTADEGWGSKGLTTIVDLTPRQVVVDRGRMFGVRFESSASIGDHWVLLSSSDPEVTRIDEVRTSVDDPEVEGSGGFVVFDVEGVRAGATELVFVNCFQGACDEERLPDEAQIADEELDTATVSVVVRGER